jgi:DNA-binding transcriptional MerR regulator
MIGPDARTIGEVLALLQPEFDDITISKIRYLEGQGLIDPERTPSGYRKFRDSDVERLRWILRQQRDNFLPLRVIKQRLISGDLDDPADSVQLELPTEPMEAPAPLRSVAALAESPTSGRVTATITEPGRRRHPTGRRGATPANDEGGRLEPDAVDPLDADVALSIDDLCSRSGLDRRSISELESYGLLEAEQVGERAIYNADALAVARLAAGFFRRGIDARHLRMYRVSAEREAALFEQLIAPLLRQRRAEARDEAVEILEELAELSDDLRAVMVRVSLRRSLGLS